jgi:hypothetical protein
MCFSQQPCLFQQSTQKLKNKESYSQVGSNTLMANQQSVSDLNFLLGLFYFQNEQCVAV